ncbi:BQ5605_C011g06256 [Microbotryum silenes-dioicae]|uniref:BQ5605_C011g06256 protein n=1 Tax=Microbotryum silenes-dioicae TaxID=796604 RepID=A0A2X0LNJ2_9BASI|nr:BQ5605_C011g06256 [Microbotryum silenes-dioicae]
MSLPPLEKDNPIPCSLKRTVNAIKLVDAALSAEILTEDARRDLITKLSLEAGLTRNHPSGDIKLVFWLGQLRAIPTDTPLAINNLSELHPIIAQALVSGDGYYCKRATSAALTTPNAPLAEGAFHVAQAAPAAAVVPGPPSIVTIEGVGKVPSYHLNALPWGMDGIVIVEKCLFVFSTQFDATQFPVGCLAQLVTSPRGMLVSTQDIIDNEEQNWADVKSERMEQLMRLAGSPAPAPAPARPPIHRAQTAPLQAHLAPPTQQYPSVYQPTSPTIHVPTAEPANDKDRRYRLECLNAACAAPAYSADPKVIGRLSQEASWDKARMCKLYGLQLASGVSLIIYKSAEIWNTSTHLASGVSPMRRELKKLGARNLYF